MQLVNAKTSMHMRTAILDYSQLAYNYIYKISLSQKTPHWLAKIAQRHAPAFGVSHILVLDFIQSKKGSPHTYDVIFTKIMYLRSTVAQFVEC